MPEPVSVPLPPPRITRRGLTAIGAGWLIYGLAYASLLTIAGEVPAGWAFVGQALSVPILAGLSVPAWLASVQRLDGAGWGRRVAHHVVAAPVYSAVALGLYILAIWALFGAEARAGVVAAAPWIAFGYVFTYAVQFAIYHTVQEATRARRQTAVAEAYRALAREGELQALRAKIHPHFLLNALHAINAKIDADPRAARDMVADLGELLRYTLRSSDTEATTLGQEVQFAEAYLRLQAHRFPDRMRVGLHLSPGVFETAVPPVVLQPLVDNAVKHGVERGVGTTTVTLGVLRSAPGLAPGAVRVCVLDDGPAPTAGAPRLRAAAPSSGVGVQNTDARLRLYYGAAAALHAEPLPEGGFQAWFDIPAEHIVYKSARAA